MQQPQYTTLHTSHLEAVRPCPACGSGGPHALAPGAAPWAAQLTCHCGQHVRWLSKYQAKQYRLSQQASSQAWPTTMALAFHTALRRQEVRR